MYGQHASFGDSRPAQGQGGPNQGSIAFYDLCGNGPQLAVGNGGQQQQPTKALMSPLGSSQSSPLSATNNSNLSPSDPFDSGFDSPPVCPTSTSGQYQYQDYHTTSPSHQHQQQANSYYAHMTPSQGQQQQHQQTQYYTLRTALTGSVTSDHGALSSNGGLGGSTKVSPSSSLTPNSATSTMPAASRTTMRAQLHMGHGGHPGQHHHMQFISQSHHQPQQQPTGSANHNYHQMALAHPMAHYRRPGAQDGHQQVGQGHARRRAQAGKREKKPGKKRRDPNEPQKPVSAYALFFRDTQATIKSSNPNAAFGEVSKIVASMWDTLDPEAKFNYKKRTEQTKKEYLKALAAYRASLLSTASNTGHSLPSTNNNTLIHLLTK
ncbi:TOX high mobility group box family member 3 [Halotydeus destructor]|nr:TOX high mobility group box family member 3 [Halotydeus destructor]